MADRDSGDRGSLVERMYGPQPAWLAEHASIAGLLIVSTPWLHFGKR
jgi:hypothetical protein